MSEEEYNRLFSRNLTYFMSLNGKSQSDLSKDLKISKATISSWCNGTRVPRMDNIDILCSYFNIRRSDLMNNNAQKQDDGYYINSETQEIAEKIFQNEELRLLFKAGIDASPEDLKTTRDMLLALKRKENRNEY